MNADWVYRKKKAWQQFHKNAANCNEQMLEATSYKAAAL